MRSLVVLGACLALLGCATRPPPLPMPADMAAGPHADGFDVRAVVDEDRHEVVVWAGPFRVEPTTGGHAHGGAGHATDGSPSSDHPAHEGGGDGAAHGHMDMPAGDMAADASPPGHAGHTRSPVIPIRWPADGYFRGFSLELRDGEGNVLPRSLMHHLIAVNFDRRMFAYPVAERLFGIGTETADVRLPKTVGVPLEQGEDLGFYVMWDNETGAPIEDVYVRLSMPWTPASQAGDIVQVLPLYVDVNNVIGYTNAYDLEPGHSVRAWEFRPPVGGRLLMASGHLHDFGTVVRLEDGETGETLLEITPKSDGRGLIHGISTEIMGVWYGGIRLEEGHPYRVVGVYDSPLTETVPMGAMAHIVGIFAPDDITRWPKADPTSETWALDLTGLPAESENMMQARDAIGGGGR